MNIKEINNFLNQSAMTCFKVIQAIESLADTTEEEKHIRIEEFIRYHFLEENDIMDKASEFDENIDHDEIAEKRSEMMFTLINKFAY